MHIYTHKHHTHTHAHTFSGALTHPLPHPYYSPPPSCSLVAAHDSLQPGYLHIASGDVLESSINRSPTAYLMNPPSERARYQYNTDKEMVVLKITDVNGKGLGMIRSVSCG